MAEAVFGPPVDASGAIALPWLAEPLRAALATQRGHALLLVGPPGVGQFTLARALAQGWLCEAVDDDAAASAAAPPSGARAGRPCGCCAGCRLVQAHSHPDLLVLVPEAQRDALGLGRAEEGDGGAGTGTPAAVGDEKTGKRKPSRDIRVEDVRGVVNFSQTTSARGRGKVAVIFPAERMNTVSANTLLKTLEEPPGEPSTGTRFVLAGASPDGLPPTVRSRCQTLMLPLPETGVALAWLASRAVADPAVLLAATGGQPEEALAWSRDGVTARQWLALPAQLRRGDAAALSAWPVPRVVETLLKLCHDMLRRAAGASPRYFPAESLPPAAAPSALLAWQRELSRIARHEEHPWNAGLLLESLAQQALLALKSLR